MDLEIPTFKLGGKPSSLWVQGLEVGRYLVVKTPPSLQYEIDKAGCVCQARSWGIVHIPSRTIIISCESLALALLVVDDLSRFAPSDVDGTTLEAFIEQLPIPMQEWLVHCADEPLGFREWHDQR